MLVEPITADPATAGESEPARDEPVVLDGWAWTRWVPVVAGVAAAMVALLQLFVPTTRGLADNGDFVRLLCHLEVEPVTGGEEPFFRYLHVQNDPVEGAAAGECNYRSTSEATLRVGQLLTTVSGGDGLDLRAVGVLHAAAFGAAVAALVAVAARGPGRVVLAVGAVTLLADGSLVAYFTSAYSEPTAIVGLVALVGVLGWWWRTGRPALLAAAVGVAVVVVGAKAQYGPTAALIAAALLIPPRRRESPFAGARWPRIVGAAVVLLAGVVTLAARPTELSVANRWNAVFLDLLPEADDPAAAARRLGLPPEALAYSGTNFWTQGAGAWDGEIAELIDGVEEVDIVAYYVAEPAQMVDLLVDGVAAVGDPQLDYLGKTTAAEPPGSADACRWCPVTVVGRALGTWSAVPVLLVWVAAAVVAVRGRRWATSPACWAAALCVGISVSQLLVVVFGEGSWELRKHLSLATTATLLAGVLIASCVADSRAQRGGRVARSSKPAASTR